MEFSQDGSLLLISTMNGFVFGYMLGYVWLSYGFVIDSTLFKFDLF